MPLRPKQKGSKTDGLTVQLEENCMIYCAIRFYAKSASNNLE